MAKSYDRLKMKDESVKIYKVLLKINSKNVRARFELGKVYISQGKVKEGEELFKECIEIDNEDVIGRFELAKLYARNGSRKII